MMLGCNPLRRRQIIIFTTAWVAYAATYFLRKPLGVIKVDLEKELSLTNSQLGWLDTALLLPYAVMQILLGPIADKFGARRTFGVSLVLSGVSMFSFGHWSDFYVFWGLLFLNGAAQAQCWPSCVKSLKAWFPDRVTNTVFGMFGTSAFFGGVLGTTIAVYLQTSFGWRNVFFVPSLVLCVLGVVVLLVFHSPEEARVEVPGKDAGSGKSNGNKPSIIELFKIPMVAEVSFAMFCLKVVRYCMYMWLPMYLLKFLQYSTLEAGMFSTMFELGGVVGSFSIGFVMDKFYKGRTLQGTAVAGLLSTLALISFYATSDWGIVINSCFMILAGVFNCGPDAMLSASIPAQLGEANGRDAAAATVGLVNGFGTLGTVLEGPIIGFITNYWGWSYMFYLLIGVSSLGTLSIVKASIIHKNLEKSKISSAEIT